MQINGHFFFKNNKFADRKQKEVINMTLDIVLIRDKPSDYLYDNHKLVFWCNLN